MVRDALHIKAFVWEICYLYKGCVGALIKFYSWFGVWYFPSM